jgi:hypothetical protein
MNINGGLALSLNGYSSGGFIGDSKVTGQVDSGSQQQYILRNDNIGSWTGGNWNMVFVGSTGVPGQSFPTYTTVGTSPTISEKPYLYVDGGACTGVRPKPRPSRRTEASPGPDAAPSPSGPVSQRP